MNYWKNGHVPKAPYYAVIFVLERGTDLTGYAEMDELTLKLVKDQDGFLGYENTGNGSEGIFISYWESHDAIDKWRKHEVHLQAKAEGKARWYKRYLSQICKVEHSHEHLNP